MNSKKITPYIELCAISLTLILILFFGDVISENVRDSLAMSAERVLPTLFPYMVLSSVIVSADLFSPLYRKIPTERLFGLPKVTASVILTGFVCGFPVGASGASKLFEDKKITHDEAARLCAISSSVSPSFLIGCVGALWNCVEFGIFLYLSGIMFNILSGIFIGRKNKIVSHDDHAVIPNKKTPSVIELLCRSISDAAVSCVSVTAFITFFRCSAAILSCIIPSLSSIFTAVFEFSSGAILGASMGEIGGAVLCGFSIGFSGLSVMMQTFSFTRHHKIPLKLTFVLAIIRGAVLAAASALFFALHKMTPDRNAMTVSDNFSPETIIYIMTALFTAIIVCNICRHKNYFKRKY